MQIDNVACCIKEYQSIVAVIHTVWILIHFIRVVLRLLNYLEPVLCQLVYYRCIECMLWDFVVVSIFYFYDFRDYINWLRASIVLTSFSSCKNVLLMVAKH